MLPLWTSYSLFALVGTNFKAACVFIFQSHMPRYDVCLICVALFVGGMRVWVAYMIGRDGIGIRLG